MTGGQHWVEQITGWLAKRNSSRGAPPANLEQPRLRVADEFAIIRMRRGKPIDEVLADFLAPPLGMGSIVPEDIRKRAAYFGGRTKDARVVPIFEHCAAGRHHRIETTGEADGDALHSGRQRRSIERLDQKMNVVPLHRKLRHAEVVTLPDGAQRPLEYAEASPASEIPYMPPHTQGDVQWVPCADARPRAVGYSSLITFRLSPSSRPATSPTAPNLDSEQ
jgi:hypothetical protein